MSEAVMVQMAACPACRQWVALRGQWTDEQPVRCPHCQAEYSAGEARKHSVPELIPVGEVGTANLANAEQTAEVEAPWPEVRSQVGTQPEGPRPGWPKLEDATGAGAAPAKFSARRPRRKPANPVAELAKIIGGGAAGLAVGYVILLWLGGPKNDFLEILPRLPEWLRDRVEQRAPRFERRQAADEDQDAPSDALEETDRRVDLEAPPVADQAAQPDAVTVTPWPLAVAPSTPAEVRQAVAAFEIFLAPPPATAEKGAAPAPAEQRAAATAAAWERAIDLATRLGQHDATRAAELEAVKQLAIRRLAAGDAEAWNRRAAAQLSDRSYRDQGIALAGRLQQVERRGTWFLSHLVLSGEPKLAALVSAQPLEFKPGDDLAVLGLAIDNPRQRFAGYEGPAQGPVVWPGLVVKIAARAAKTP